jgi:hypothetical protein
LNPGPHGPEPCALPNCASPRRMVSHEDSSGMRGPRVGLGYSRGAVRCAAVSIRVALASATRAPSRVRSIVADA